MSLNKLHLVDAAAAAYRRRAYVLGLTDVSTFTAKELAGWAAEDARELDRQRSQRAFG